MKKLITLLLTAALAITAATTAFAADTQVTAAPNGTPNPSSGDIYVSYEVQPKYIVTIPKNVTLNATDPSKVTATDVTIPYGQTLTVTLSSDTGFKVKAGTKPEDPTLTYKVWKGTTEVTNVKNTVLEVKSGTGSAELKFVLDDKNVTYSGTYTDTVTFTVSVG